MELRLTGQHDLQDLLTMTFQIGQQPDALQGFLWELLSLIQQEGGGHVLSAGVNERLFERADPVQRSPLVGPLHA